MSEAKEVKHKIAEPDFITLWNSDRLLSEIADEKGVKELSMKMRANTIRKRVLAQKETVENRLEKARDSNNEAEVQRLESQYELLDVIVLKDRKGGRKTGLEGLLETARKLQSG